MSEPLSDRELVLSRHPHAYLREDTNPLAYSRWLVLYQPNGLFCIGSGPTQDEAWRNARIHTSALIALEARQGQRLLA